ncbi:universal stress protein [Pigmentiphaga kullae]|uniref:Nucleotide-binding universal stress UspA family protein n=1 Tax=Pigmentiphaga kullae TaxID=151784 RepID=A0A4Q7NDJ3_9BURK|nr:universal stress protein [Pigmentiphaga kullae]RZS81033.1 nucleotide-binding universal stress UspA family protein [Pigmentiphaga kullae]
MYTKLLVPIDGSATSRLALEEAVMLARLSGARIELLHVVDELEHIWGRPSPVVYIKEVRPMFLKAGQDLLDETRAEIESQGIEVDTVLLESRGTRASELIAGQAAKSGVDAIVMGTHGRRGVDRVLIGSDAEQVVRLSSVPVMLVRQARSSVAAA